MFDTDAGKTHEYGHSHYIGDEFIKRLSPANVEDHRTVLGTVQQFHFRNKGMIKTCINNGDEIADQQADF
jgi:hypothetical protein